MRQIGVIRVAGHAAGIVGLLLVVSCGGEGEGGEGALPTISPTRTPTASLPSPELPTPTRSPDLPTPTRSPDLPTPTEPSSDLPTPAPTPTRTRTPDESPSPEETVTQPTSEPSSQEPSSQEPEPGSTAPTPRATGESDDPSVDAADGELEDDNIPVWVWWLLGVLVVGAVVAVLLVLRAGRRRAWRQEVDEAEGELAWLARELLPGLRQSGSREQVAGGWSVSRERVAAAEDRLTVLESSAPTEADAQRARSLRDAVRAAQGRMEQLTRPEPVDTWIPELDAVIADLETALHPDPPPSRQ